MKNIFIIGSKGYRKHYGGWETFVTNLIDNYNDNNTKFYVSEITDNKLIKETNINDVVCNPIYMPKLGSATMLLYSIKSLFYYLKYIKSNNLKNCYIYILGLKMGPFLWMLKRRIRKLNIKVIVNPDGLEWARSKWNWFVKQYFKLSERMMLYNCDEIICDAIGIKDYIESMYKKIKVSKTYIAYGVNEIKFDNNEIDLLNKYNLKKDDYYLIVGRFVPENNYELIIKEFIKSNTKKQLIIVSNIEENKFYYDLLKNTKFDKDKRIIILGAIYDTHVLGTIRKNAYAYIHGHSVGGTNPSLLESLSLTKLNLLYDCIFNREVGEDSCLYFNKEENNLSNLINNTDKLSSNQINEFQDKALNRIKEAYTWDIVVDKYKKVFNR